MPHNQIFGEVGGGCGSFGVGAARQAKNSPEGDGAKRGCM